MKIKIILNIYYNFNKFKKMVIFYKINILFECLLFFNKNISNL